MIEQYIHQQRKVMDPQFEVQEIIQERTYQSKGQSITEYKVKWKGYALKDATWQPIDNLQRCQEKLNDFKSKSKKEKSPEKQKKETKKITKQRKKTKNIEPQNMFVATTSNNQLYFSDQSHDAPILQPQPIIKPLNKSVQVTPKRSTTPKPKRSPIKNKKPPKIKVPKKQKIKQKKKPKKQKKILKINKKYQKKNQADLENQKNARQANQRMRSSIMQQFPTRILKPITQRKYIINIPKTQVKSQHTQTNNKQNPSLVVKAIHYSQIGPSNLYFTVKQQGQYRQISRQTLLDENPRALYNFYRSHYLKAKQKDAQLKKSVKQILQGKSSIDKLNIDANHNDQYNVHMKQIKKQQKPISVREWKQQFKKQLQSQKKGKPLSRRNRLMIGDQSILSIQSYDEQFKFENDESYLDSSIADSSLEHQTFP